MMRGTLLHYDRHADSGLISGHDGKRYRFKREDFVSDEGFLETNAEVDFDVLNDEARAIFTAPEGKIVGNAFNEIGGKSRVLAALLAFFFGGLGIHKFYLGYNRAGIIMLLVTGFGFILLGIPSIIIGIIAFIEAIIYLTKSDQDFYRIYVKNRKEWF